MHLNDLTVVLTLKDRASFTYRWMCWMDGQKFPYKILIADGGADKNVEVHLMDHRNYPNLDYEYIRYPYDSDLEVFLKKLFDVAARVKTEFVIVADNDDFILLGPLERNLQLMRERTDVHTIGPLHYRFRIDKKTESLDDLVCAGDATISFRKGLCIANNKALEDSNPLTRMLEVVEMFYSGFIYYGVHRTVDYQRLHRGLEKLMVKRLIFHEWYTIYSYAVAGKIILVSTEPFLVRQDDTSQGASSTYHLENRAYVFLLRDWSEQLYKIIDDLYQQLVGKGCALDREKYEECFRDAFRKHMLAGMEFRGVADKFKKFPRLHAIARRLFAFYRGHKDIKIAGAGLKKNQDLYRVSCFLKEYKHPQSTLISETPKTN